jgi:hypothetical protein
MGDVWPLELGPSRHSNIVLDRLPWCAERASGDYREVVGRGVRVVSRFHDAPGWKSYSDVCAQRGTAGETLPGRCVRHRNQGRVLKTVYKRSAVASFLTQGLSPLVDSMTGSDRGRSRLSATCQFINRIGLIVVPALLSRNACSMSSNG